MKFQIHENGAIDFVCDSCGKMLDEQDPGEVYFRDFEWFMDHIEEAGPDSCWFLCGKCFAKHRGTEQAWYDDRWKALEGEQS